jgi:hypothetical protein
MSAFKRGYNFKYCLTKMGKKMSYDSIGRILKERCEWSGRVGRGRVNYVRTLAISKCLVIQFKQFSTFWEYLNIVIDQV